jgi:indole-3-glycerol phosphate synthase
MMILDEIVAAKRRELARAQAELPLSELEKRISRRKPALDFADALCGDSVRIIAEIKKASPSKGLLCPSFDPLNLAKAYAEGGAAAISVLTETSYFQGALTHLLDIKQTPALDKIPLLRKDFLFSPYQVYESRAFGADAILLIAAILTDEELAFLISMAHELGMQCLVEVHDRPELERVIRSPARIIGINNRDLRTFDVDIATTERLCPLIPEDRLIVSESGIKERKDIQRLKQYGVDAVLIGEALVTASDIGAKLKELI